MNIYLDIDGTLIHEDFADIGQPAAGLPEFIMALRPHEVYWLTTHCMDGDPLLAQELVKSVLSEELHPEIDRIKPTEWAERKTEAIDFSGPFMWFDDAPSPEDLVILSEANPDQLLIEMNLVENPDQLREIVRDVL